METEGRPELQQARKRAAGEVEGLLRYLEGNATHPSRLAIEELTQEAQNMLNEGVVGPFRQGQALEAFEISEELVEAVQDVAMRLAQVKTGGSVPLRKARYKALTRVCAVQEILEGRVRTNTLALPLSDDTHEAVQRINQVMAQVSGIAKDKYQEESQTCYLASKLLLFILHMKGKFLKDTAGKNRFIKKPTSAFDLKQK